MDDMLRFGEELRLGGEAAYAGVPALALNPGPADWAAELRGAIQRLVVPRLHQAHAKAAPGQSRSLSPRLVDGPAVRRPSSGERQVTIPADGPSGVAPHTLALFVDHLVADNRERCQACIAAQIAAGLSYERLFLDLFGAAAVHVHEMQDRDVFGMAEGALAYATLASIMRAHAPAFQAEAAALETGRRALLAAPLLRHDGLSMFGLLLLSEFFKRDGWDSWVERDFSGGAVRNLVLKEWFDLVEVIVASDQELDMVSTGIRAIRRNSRNHAVSVMVCGEIFDRHPELVRAVGADLGACDPLTSLSQAKLIAAGSPSRGQLS